jgi:uncharacterized integral membrane protein
MTQEDSGNGLITPRFVAIVILVVLTLVIVFQNTQMVTFRLFFWNISMSQIILIPLMLLIGFVVGLLTQAYLSRRKDKRLQHVSTPML